MTFLEGFANAYIAADQKKQQREQDQEDTMFKYKMENLMADKKLRVAKQAQELQNAKSAQDLAVQYGDASTAPYWQTQLNNGVNYDTLYKGVANGDYTPNKSYQKPTQTVKVPPAVTMTYDTGMDGPQYAQIDKRIDTIDPTLRKEDVTPTVNDTSGNSMLTYNPKQQKNLPDPATLWNNLAQAQAQGDPAAVRKAQQELTSYQQSYTWQQKQQANLQGKSGSQQGVVLDDKGRIVPGGLVNAETRFDPETQRYVTYNVSDLSGDGQGTPISGNFKYLNPQQIQRLNDLNDKFGKSSAELKDSSANYISALTAANVMDRIAQQDPAAVTKYTAGALTTLNSLKGEAGAAWSKLQQIEQRMNKNRASGAEDTYEKDANDYAQALADFSNASVTSPENERTAINAALYNSAKTSFIVNMSTANGLSQSKSSDKDYQNYMTMIGGNSSNYNTIRPVMRQALNIGLSSIDAKRNSINKDPAIYGPSGFKQQTGIDPGLSVDRIEDMINNSETDDTTKMQLIAYLKSIRQPQEFGIDKAGAQGAEQLGLDPTKEAGYRDPVVSAPNYHPVPTANEGTPNQDPAAPAQSPTQKDKGNQTIQDQINSGAIKPGTIFPGAGGKKYKLKDNYDPKKGLTKDNFEEVK